MNEFQMQALMGFAEAAFPGESGTVTVEVGEASSYVVTLVEGDATDIAEA